MTKPELLSLKYNIIEDNGFITKDLNLFIEDLEEYITFIEDAKFKEGYDEGEEVGYSQGLLDCAQNSSNVNI